MKTLLSFAILSFVGFQAQATGPSVTSGGGNPSAVYCIQGGGTYEIVVDSRGNESAVCYFGQAGIEPWGLFRAAKYKMPNEAVAAFLKSGKASEPTLAQAKANCKSQGGSVETYKLKAQKTAVYMCGFEDGSEIELRTLFLGAAAPEARKLVNALGQN